MASRNWIKKDYIIKEVPCALILDAAKNVYPCEYYRLPIQLHVSIHNRFWYPRLSLPHSFAAALWCHRCKLKMNLHPKCQHHNTVACNIKKPRRKVQGCVGYWVCFGMRGVVLCKRRNVEIRMLAVCILRKENR